MTMTLTLMERLWNPAAAASSSSCDAYLVGTRSARGQHTVSSRSAHGQHTVRTRLARGQHTSSTRSACRLGKVTDTVLTCTASTWLAARPATRTCARARVACCDGWRPSRFPSPGPRYQAPWGASNASYNKAPTTTPATCYTCVCRVGLLSLTGCGCASSPRRRRAASVRGPRRRRSCASPVSARSAHDQHTVSGALAPSVGA